MLRYGRTSFVQKLPDRDLHWVAPTHEGAILSCSGSAGALRIGAPAVRQRSRSGGEPQPAAAGKGQGKGNAW